MPEPEHGRPISVVLDTNVLQKQGWSLGSDPMRVLEHQSGSGALAPYVPEVVRLELEEHGTKAAETAANRYRSVVEMLQQLGAGHDLDPTAELKTDAYPARLTDRLAELGADILPTPDVPHADVMRRAIAGRKPFKLDGARGYKDTLIWLTVIDLLNSKGPPIALVSDDPDFRDDPKSDELAADLIDDLERAGYPADAVRVYRSISQLIAGEVPEIQQFIARFAERLRTDEPFRDLLTASMIVLCDEEGPAFLERRIVVSAPFQVAAVRLQSFEPTQPPRIEAAGEAADGSRPVELSIEGTVEVSVSFEPQDAQLPLATPLRSQGQSVLVTQDTLAVEWMFDGKFAEGTDAVADLRLAGMDVETVSYTVRLTKSVP
jgi:PIN domain